MRIKQDGAIFERHVVGRNDRCNGRAVHETLHADQNAFRYSAWSGDRVEIGMWRAAIQRVAGNPDRHDAFMPARAALLEDLAADPSDGTGAPVREGQRDRRCAGPDGLFAAIRKDRRPTQEALRRPAGATASARASVPTGASVSTRAASPPNGVPSRLWET